MSFTACWSHRVARGSYLFECMFSSFMNLNVKGHMIFNHETISKAELNIWKKQFTNFPVGILTRKKKVHHMHVHRFFDVCLKNLNLY